MFLRFHWTTKPAPAQPSELVLTPNPLAEPPCAWFEDYFNYPADFTAIYTAAKQTANVLR